MSNPESNSNVRSGGITATLLTQIANAAWQRMETGEKRIYTKIRLHNRPALPLLINKSRSVFGSKLSVSLDETYASCQRCRKSFEKTRTDAEGVHSVIYLLQEAINIIQSCNCSEIGSALVSSVEESEPTVLRIRAEPTGGRIKVLSPGIKGAADPQQPSTTREGVIRVRNSSRGITVLDRAEQKGDETIGDADSRESSYNVPSIRYDLSPSIKVEVTIPLHICEALIKHCGESNRHHREVGGVLIGFQYETETEHQGVTAYQNIVTDLLPFKASDSSGSHLGLDENSWVHVQQIYDNKHAPQNKVRLGWYHTHPTQGIFFSPQDRDAHTIFRQTHQFALVIDPQRMDAGLFYWEKYDTRSLGGPQTFNLKRQGEYEINPNGSTRVRDKAGVNDLPLSLWRLSSFLLVACPLIAYIAADVIKNSPPYAVNPTHACLVALIALLGLRLWNANYFHPRTVIEVTLVNKVVSYLRISANAIGSYISKISDFQRNVLLVVLAALIFVLTLYWLVQNYTSMFGRSDEARPTQQPSSGNNQQSPSEARAENSMLLSVVENASGGSTKLSLLSANHDASVTYVLRSGSDEAWDVDLQSEQQFFRKVFQWEIRSRKPLPYISELQTYLRQGDERGGIVQPDGLWGETTRRLFLRKIMDSKKLGIPMSLPLPDKRLMLVSIN